MDVLQLLIARLDRLPSGDHSNGLKAVRLHVEAAIGHFRRGQQEGDETAFTDSIYRCNQAFEGSIKEAYRVLALKTPDKVTLAEAETFMTTSGIIRKKVLDQFTNYRREWRNPSTHDYMLDFDEDEALLAIVSVIVFSIVLCDQIENRLAFVAAQSTTTPAVPLPTGRLLDQVAEVLKRFAESYSMPQTDLSPQIKYERVQGALAAFLGSELSGAVIQNPFVGGVREMDALISASGEIIAIELKTPRRLRKDMVDHAVRWLDRVITSAVASGGVALMLPADAKDYRIADPDPPHHGIKLVIPQSWQLAKR